MKKTFSFFCLLMINSLFAQNNYELGYYVGQSGEMVNGESSEISIENFPEVFYFKQGKKIEEISTATVSKIKYGTRVFEKRDFHYDPSLRLNIDEMPTQSDINLINHSAFVELLVNGEHKLYKYVEKGVFMFFYEDVSNNLVLLQYKKYINSRQEISENKTFQIQLKNTLPNPAFQTENDYKSLKYNDQDLISYFKEVNGKHLVIDKISKLKFNIFAGYAIHTMDINFVSDIPSESYSHITVVPEIEYVLNVNKLNPTSFYLNAKLHTIKKEFVEPYTRENWNHQVNYQSLFVAFGAKQYFLSSNKTKFYAKAGLGFNTPLKYEISSPYESWLVNPILLDRITAGINGGLGTVILNSFIVEVDYDLLFNTPHINKNSSLNLKIGYTF